MSNDKTYHCPLDNKENNFLNLESDSEDGDLTLCISDFVNSPAQATDMDNPCFDLSLDSDTEQEFEEVESLELEWDDDCNEGDDLFSSMQEEQSENLVKSSGDQLVYRIPDISFLSFNNLTDFDENNYMEPSHDDLSSATVEVLAVSTEPTPDCDIKDTATTCGIVTVDELCCSTVTTLCFTSSQDLTGQDVCSPVNVNVIIKAELEKQNCICSVAEIYPSSDFGEIKSKCVVSTASVLQKDECSLPVENVSNAIANLYICIAIGKI